MQHHHFKKYHMTRKQSPRTHAEFQNRRNIYAGFNRGVSCELEYDAIRDRLILALVPAKDGSDQSKEPHHPAADRDNGRDGRSSNSSGASKVG